MFGKQNFFIRIASYLPLRAHVIHNYVLLIVYLHLHLHLGHLADALVQSDLQWEERKHNISLSME